MSIVAISCAMATIYLCRAADAPLEASAAPQSRSPTDEEIRSVLQQYIERDHWGGGIVVGIVDERGPRIISYGKMDHGENPPVDGDTLFEIGSITKTFTTLLLEQMIERGEMSLDDPVEKFLPSFFTAGDPAPWITKRLRVRYRLKSKIARLEVQEGDMLELPAGAELLHAVYGDLAARDRTADVTGNVASLVKSSHGAAVKVRAENNLAIRKLPLKAPAWGERKITLRDLATHTSGLPRERQGDIYEFLSRCRLPRRPGTKPEYSNFGVSLLAHAIELRAGTNYETLIKERICRPLQMGSTCITPTPELRARLAKSHNQENRTVGDLADELASLPGAGAIRSTANDMLKYVAAEAGLEDTPLTPSMERTHTIQFRQAFGEADLALPWWIFHRRGAEIITHGGTTWGHQAFIGFDKKAKRGVVVLANRADVLEQAVRPLGLYLLAPMAEQTKPVQIAADVLDSYSGLYEFKVLPEAILSIRPVDNRILAQFLNCVADEWLPVSNTEFVDRWRTGTTLKFTKDYFGRTTAVFTGPDGKAWRARRIHEEIPEELFRPVEKPLRPEECAPRNDSDLQGSWEATARVWYWPFASLDGTLRIAENPAGVFQAEFEFPELNATGLAVFVHYHPPDVELISKSGSGMFSGKINREHTQMNGYYIAGGRHIRTVLRRKEP